MTRYKLKYLCVIIVTIFLCVIYVILKNVEPQVSSRDILFSAESGFYDEPFMLEIQSEGDIYYTLDGTIPSKKSARYEAPIFVTDSTENENNYSKRTDTTVAFDGDAIETLSYGGVHYIVPDYKVDKATVIRAVAYFKDGSHSECETRSYFVGFQNKIGYDGMNVLSIVTDPDNLFGYENGIYVTGKAYDEYKKKYRENGEWIWTEEIWNLWPSNYLNTGMAWEREVETSFFTATQDGHELLSEQTCGARIHGGFSRALNPKSLNLYARKKYDDNKTFDNNLFPNAYNASELTLFQGGQDTGLLKDSSVSKAIEDLDVATMQYIPYILFLDGEYWGVYQLTDKFSPEYFHYNYGVNKDNIIMIKNNELEVGNEDDIKLYNQLISFGATQDLSLEENYSVLEELVDIDSCIDYYATMLYVGRYEDWPRKNIAMWRVRKMENGSYGDGKWRYMVFDLNSEGFDTDLDSITYCMENDPFFAGLMKNESFKNELFDRMLDLSEKEFKPENINHIIEENADILIDSMGLNYRRFYGEDTTDYFENEIKQLESFFDKRGAIVKRLIAEYESSR